MSSSRRIWIAGLIGTAVFALIMDLAPAIHGPRLNIALWDGTFVTLNLRVAIIVGYVLEFLIGVGLAAAYHKYWRYRADNPLIGGVLYGALLWAVFMAFGIPLFDRISPLVRHGLMLGPGAFLWRLGLAAPILWLAASMVFGSTVGYVMDGRLTLSRR
ncbi:MAG: hypothetical protein M0Z36_12735 [Thermaerobacter sp.]|nr:hypothetical protein [Thermaerobacter sp.]